MSDVEGKVEKEEEVIVSMVARRGGRGWGGGGRPWAGVKESGEMKIPKYLPLSICLPN